MQSHAIPKSIRRSFISSRRARDLSTNDDSANPRDDDRIYLDRWVNRVISRIYIRTSRAAIIDVSVSAFDRRRFRSENDVSPSSSSSRPIGACPTQKAILADHRVEKKRAKKTPALAEIAVSDRDKRRLTRTLLQRGRTRDNATMVRIERVIVERRSSRRRRRKNRLTQYHERRDFEAICETTGGIRTNYT